MSTFFGSPSIIQRSIFVDKGPIVKPPLLLSSGVSATVVGPNTVNLPGGSFSVSDIGLEVELVGGGGPNAGRYRIVKVNSNTQVQLLASFTTPDAFSYTWELYDPRRGEIADSPQDVTVRINSVPVLPVAVDGLLGQVVLTSTPLSTDTVDIDYLWIRQPTVRMLLNHEGMTLNASRPRGSRRVDPKRSHSYSYNVVLGNPAKMGVSDSLLAVSPQPKLRQLHYRAYERRYTAALNNPQLFRLNAPTNRIAYPPTQRKIVKESVVYDATVLPSLDSQPWDQRGQGLASVALDRLTLEDNTVTHPLFYTRTTDLTFDHVFAMAWRSEILSVTDFEGVWSGLGAGWVEPSGRVFLLGHLFDSGAWSIGVLKDHGDYPTTLGNWSAVTAFDPFGQKTYRVVRSSSGLYSVYLDGGVVEAFSVHESSLPYLKDLVGPFDQIQSVFFGSLSQVARSSSLWEFVRYESFPLTFTQTLISSFVNYEANAVPELSPSPWNLLGGTGYETIESGDTLLLKNTSATTVTDLGVVSGAYRSFLRLEPLFKVSVDTVLDFEIQGRDFTHSVEPYGVFASLYDGSRLAQVSLLSAFPTPKFSYPGLTLPENSQPESWTLLGGGVDPSNVSINLEGRSLRIKDTSDIDGAVYFLTDNAPVTSSTRLLDPLVDYRAEARFKVVSYTPDLAGFCGVTFDVYDGTPLSNGRPVGVLLRETLGVKEVAFHRDGVVLSSTPFDWGDGLDHTYRVTKDVVGDLLSLFVDDTLTLTQTYSGIAVSAGNGVVSFGSSTAASVAAHSEVVWSYFNVWRVPETTHLYVGLWKGTSTNSLRDYLLPTNAQGSHGLVAGNTIQDTSQNFIAAGVGPTDVVVIDDGPNQGVYFLTAVNPTSLVFSIPSPFPVQGGEVAYRVLKKHNWVSSSLKLRLVRDPRGGISLYEGANTTPEVLASYDDLPQIKGLVGVASGGLPCVCFGSMDPTNLSTTAWEYVRYGAVSVPDASQTVNRMFRLNQRNVIASPEHLRTDIPHNHTDYWSSSTGIPPQGPGDLHQNPLLPGYTQLNEGVPLVPSTQTLENRRPTPVSVPVNGLNNPQSFLNSQGFLLNDTTSKVKVIVPPDVLYNCLEVIEFSTGEENLITPVQDVGGLVSLGTFSFTKEVCLVYDGAVLPENDPSASTPWVLQFPLGTVTSVSSGVLSYSTVAPFTTTAYTNNTPLPDVLGHNLKVSWRVKISQDGSFGLGDSEVRLGFSAPGLTLALAFVTYPTGERLVLVKDLKAHKVVAGLPFDFLDNAFHTYMVERLLTSPQPTLRFRIDPP